MNVNCLKIKTKNNITMKIEINTDDMTIKLKSQVSLSEFVNFIKNNLTNWEYYDLITENNKEFPPVTSKPNVSRDNNIDKASPISPEKKPDSPWMSKPFTTSDEMMENKANQWNQE